jgi:hypothetical protein
LNALKRIRNDAAHSSNNFELTNLNKELKSVYDLIPGFGDIIKEAALKIVAHQYFDIIDKTLNQINVSDETERQAWIEKFKNDKESIAKIEKRVPYVELIYGLCFICGSIVAKKNIISKLKNNNLTISELVNNQKAD